MASRSGQDAGFDRERFFVQAPIPPLREDGFDVFLSGTVLAILFTLLALVRISALSAAGHGWLLWVGVSCIVIGLGGTGYCWLRRALPGQSTRQA